MSNKLRDTLDAVKYAAGPAQFLLFGLFSFVLSGLFLMDNWLTLSATIWKFMGVGIIIATIWGGLAHRRAVMMATVFMIGITGSFYFTTFDMFTDSDELRAAMQTKLMIIFLMLGWGFYLANLISRQVIEFERMLSQVIDTVTNDD